MFRTYINLVFDAAEALQLKGTLLTGTPDINAGSVKLLQQVIPIWVREDGDPRNP